jgi:hypothetical protein
VHWFDAEVPRKDINQPRVKRSYVIGSPRVQDGGIVELPSFARFVQLVPHFGKAASPSLEVSIDDPKHKTFYVNTFADKEIYQAVWVAPPDN